MPSDNNLPKKSHYHHLKEKWTNRHRDLQKKLWEKHKDSLEWAVSKIPAKQIAMGSLSGLLMLAAPNMSLLPPPPPELLLAQSVEISENAFLVSDLTNVIPKEMRPLTIEEETRVGELLTRDFGFRVTAELEEKKLNRSYGLIGAEQHLMRYPGDTMSSHFANPSESQGFYSSGMAPGRGAWGYFAYSQSRMTEIDVQREKYYIAVQTFLIPDYNQRVAEYRDFFKFRKMLVVNPNNGQAVVVVIGDAGPAEWTGKHLGGSPEVMRHLERVDGKQRGPVLYFFIDDPDDKIPLGPIQIPKNA